MTPQAVRRILTYGIYIDGFGQKRTDRRSTLFDLRRTVNGLRARVNQIEQELEDRPRTYLSVITDLGDERYTLISDVTIALEEYRDEVVARWPDVGVYASGTTELEAIAGIKWQVVELFEELRTMKAGTLGRTPLSWKRVLRRAIKVNAQVP